MADKYKLVPLADLKSYLDIDALDTSADAELTVLRDAVEALLESDTNQEFAKAASDLEETHDGTGTRVMWTRRPIASVTSVVLTYGPTDSPTTLSITAELKYRVGKRRLSAQWYHFPEGRDNVIITYDAQANQPPLAIQAVKEACATLYRTKGSEDARSEQLGTFTHVMKRDLKESLLWIRAVSALTIFPIG